MLIKYSLFLSSRVGLNLHIMHIHQELCHQPSFIDSEGASRFDLDQGELGKKSSFITSDDFNNHIIIVERVTLRITCYMKGC